MAGAGTANGVADGHGSDAGDGAGVVPVAPRRTGASLVLVNGVTIRGWSFGAPTSTSGEAVFQTGMVGYTEALTDPSYRGQLLVLTFPLAGNYGAPDPTAVDAATGLPVHLESTAVHAAALVVSDYCGEAYSHWTAKSSLGSFLAAQGVPAIAGVDTRRLTQLLRERGSLLAKLLIDGSANRDATAAAPFVDPATTPLVAAVAHPEVVTYHPDPALFPVESTRPRILVIDCGLKVNQLRCLLSRGAIVTRVPFDHDYSAADAAGEYDGIFVSNGPGDPSTLGVTIAGLQAAMERRPTRPIFGICLGHQLLSLAAGFRTYKLKYGNRGHNQPAVEEASGRCFITSQNHGYAVDMAEASRPRGWIPLFTNANDGTNEGVIHTRRPFFAVQFHPEAHAGPRDTAYLFDSFLAMVAAAGRGELDVTDDRSEAAVGSVVAKLVLSSPAAPFRFPAPAPASAQALRKVLVLGSGGLTIGQAGEFDFSTSQALKALRAESVRTVLINPNVASVQTSKGMADKVYFLPVDPVHVAKVARNERPDGILVTFGGQTALNCGLALEKAGTLAELGIRVLGTPMATIEDTEDRSRFNARLSEIGEPFANSRACETIDEALAAAEEVGYPVILRAAFALGGLGSGFANNASELRPLATKALSASSQVLVERSMKGWKEIEYEVVRDAEGNCVTVCNMENFDALGVHTGDSVVVAPSQTLSDSDYNMLRDSAIRTVRHLGVVGECNVQYALNPHSSEYCIIEVNARLSRSSALASKATGYPLAFVAAKIALGGTLPVLRNLITRKTTACFEPSLDYVVVKVPRWDLNKFTRVSRKLGSAMKSVGEVMAIGRTFEEAFQKALRMVSDYSVDGFVPGVVPYSVDAMAVPTDRRVLAMASGLAAGESIETIHRLSEVDRWFIRKLADIVGHEAALRASAMSRGSGGAALTTELLWRAKELGFNDRRIATVVDGTELAVRKLRLARGIAPLVKRIDTVAAEFPAHTNYLYMTYANARHYAKPDPSVSSNALPLAALTAPNGEAFGESGEDERVGSDGSAQDVVHGPETVSPLGIFGDGGGHDVDFNEHGTIVLGSGAYRIGSSVEFDWCAVSAVRTLRAKNMPSIMINYNPETVSTDYDEVGRLYFEELSLERVLDIYWLEAATGVLVSMGGQLPNNIAMGLHRQSVRILGTTPDMIDGAENRYKFSRMLDRLGVDQPLWKELTSVADATAFCHSVGYPVLVRPSYVLSGAAMNVAHKDDDLEAYLTEAAEVSRDTPVVVSKFILEAKEIEVDAVAREGELVMHVVSEHVENAGVHSGDATLVLPPQDLDAITVRKVEAATREVAHALNVTGPMNIQFIAKNNEIKVIECNLRASRSFPFVSKTFGIDLAKMAAKVMLGLPVRPYPVDVSSVRHVGVKVAIFSFTRLLGADPILGVEMASTGEVACFGSTREEAYLKGLIATDKPPPPPRGASIGVSIGSYKEKLEFLASAVRLVKLGAHLLATPGTADFFTEHGLPCKTVLWPSEGEFSPSEDDNVVDLLRRHQLDYFINIPSANQYRRLRSFESPGYLSRRASVEFSVPLLTNIKCAKLLVRCLDLLDSHGGRVEAMPLGAYDARYSSRVITLPGLVLLDSPLANVASDTPDADVAVQAWAKTTSAALAGGATMVCVSSAAPVSRCASATGAGSSGKAAVNDLDGFELTSRAATATAVCDWGVWADATAGNAAVVKPLARLAVGLRVEPRPEQWEAAGATAAWLGHVDTWPRTAPLRIASTGRALAALLFGAVVSGRDVHVHGLRLRGDIQMVAAAKAKRLSVTCDVNVVDLCAGAGDGVTASLSSASLGGGLSADDREALWESLDLIDAVTGPPELLLPLLLARVHAGRLTMKWVRSRLVDGPRRILGLPPTSSPGWGGNDMDGGAAGVDGSATNGGDGGSGGDTFVEIDYDDVWKAPAASAAAAGADCRGRVRRVVVRGRIAYLDGKVFAEPGSGANLRSLAPDHRAAGAGDQSPASWTEAARKQVPITNLEHLEDDVDDYSSDQVAGASTGGLAEKASRFADNGDSGGGVAVAKRPVSTGTDGGRTTPRAVLTKATAVDREAAMDAVVNVSGLPQSRSGGVAAGPRTGGVLPGYGRGWWAGRHILSVTQFTRVELHALFDVATEMKQMVARAGHYELLRGKVLALLFLEPSTRTACSFQAAMLRLGGTCLSVADAGKRSSVAKGESVEDTVRTLESYADAAIVRSPVVGAAATAAAAARKPVINAGDGVGEHPTQALLDVFTIREELGTVNGLTITFVGDLRHGRTVHSLARLLSLYSVKLRYVSPPSLRMPGEVLAAVADKGTEQSEHGSLDEVLRETDVLYVTRVQRERFESAAEYDAVAGGFVVTSKALARAKDTMIVMHPLPRLGEIHTDVDSDPRAVYFRQMEYGMYVRMALLAKVLGKA
ncbi:hypothetical protein MMPV_003930 [Pyropia vietnamensis]